MFTCTAPTPSLLSRVLSISGIAASTLPLARKLGSEFEPPYWPWGMDSRMLRLRCIWLKRRCICRVVGQVLVAQCGLQQIELMLSARWA